MVNPSREKFFQKLSKRELQFLCRNLGIPFGQRKDLLANTLAALPEHYFDSKYRSSQATVDLSSLPHNGSGLGYNAGPVQSYADFATYSLGHNMPNNQFIDSNSSAPGIEAMNVESASAREEKDLDPDYDSARGSFSQAVPQCHQADFDSNGLHLPGNTQSHLNFAGSVQAHKMPSDQFDNIHIAPLAAGIRKKREEYFLRLPKKQLISLCKKIQLPLTSTKCGLARNLATMPECYFDPEHRVDFDANGLSSQRPSSKNDSSFSNPGECNVFNSQFKDINVCPLPEGSLNVESVSKSKEVNTYQLADTSCFQPVPQYGKGGLTNQEMANTSSRVVPPCDKDGFPHNTASNKSCSNHVQQCDWKAPNIDAFPKANGKSKYIEEGAILNTLFKDMTATKLFADSMTTTKANSPSFEFHVRSDKGINLYVDLNSNLSSWARSLNRDVNIMESSSCKKAQTFQEEIVHFAESRLQNKSILSVTTQDHSSPVLRSEDKNSSSEGMGTDVPTGNEENQVLSSSRPDYNAENELCVTRTVGSTVDKVKVDSFGPLSGSMSEGSTALSMIERPSKNSIRGCYRCSFWPYGCDKCSVRGSPEMRISEATICQKTQGGTAVLSSDDKGYHSEGRDGDVPKAIGESQAVFLSKADSNIRNRISVSSIVRNASDSAKMDSLSRLKSDSLVTSEGPSKLAIQGRYRCFCWPYGCETCSMSGAVNMKIIEATDFQQSASSVGDPSHDLVNHYRNRQCEQGLFANSSEVNHGSDRSQLLNSAEHLVGGNNASEVQSPECSQLGKLFDQNDLSNLDLMRQKLVLGEVFPRRSMRA